MSRMISPATKTMTDDELAAVTVPTTLLWGRGDRMVPLAVGEAAARSQGWPLHVVEDSAHAPHVEQPERFIEDLRNAISNV